MRQTSYAYLESPIGRLMLVGDERGLRRIDLGATRAPEPEWREDAGALAEATRQLEEYFAGDRLRFDLALAPEGTAFQLRVWHELANIPYGETITYRELARRIGNPNATRAVGRANGANPLSIVLPCHRVIGSDGTLTGYGGGLPAKQKLLAHERRHAPMGLLQSC